MRNALRFLGVWMLPPAVMRLLVLLRLASYCSLTEFLADGGRAMLAGLAQDSLVGLEMLVLFLAVRAIAARLWNGRLLRVLPAVATAVFVLAQCYLLFDHELYIKTGVRMDPAFLEFLPAASSFGSSAWEMGLGGLAVGLLVILACTPRVLTWFAAAFASLRFGAWLAIVLPAVGLLAMLSHQAVQPETAYATDNLLIADQLRLLARATEGSQQIAPGAETATARFLAPKAESYEKVSARYPLLKRTTGFDGPRQFDLQLAPGERPHVVFLFLESFRAADVGVFGGRHGASPNFDRLSKEGVLFRNFYGCGVQTTRAVIASLFGIVPPMIEESPQRDVPLIGVADLFNRRGYTSAYLTGTSLGFEHQGDFFPRHGYAVVHGDAEIGRAFPQAKRTSWGYHDEYLLDYAADWLAERDRRNEPTFLTLFTITHHHPWQVPEHYRAPEFDKSLHPEYRRFLQTFLYSDHCLGRFVERLRRLGLDRRAVLFVMADTGTPQGEHQGNFMLVNYLYEENLRIPLLILAPGRLRRPAVIDDLGSQVDLLPTVMDLFGMTGLNHSIGTSLVRRVADRTVYFNNPFVLQFLGLRRGSDKYVFTVRSRRSSLYDLSEDPGEAHDLSARFPDRTAAYRAEIDAVSRLFVKLFVSGRFCRP